MQEYCNLTNYLKQNKAEQGMLNSKSWIQQLYSNTGDVVSQIVLAI